MAIPKFFPIPTSGNQTDANGGNQAVGATSVGTPITLGHNTIVRLVATGPLNVRFAAAGTTTASANDIYIPANVECIFELGRYNEVIVPYNSGAASATLYYSVVSKA